MDIITFCKYYYEISLLPIHVYNLSGKHLFTIPEQAAEILPPTLAGRRFLSKTTPIDCVSSGFDSYYGYIYAPNQNCFLILGPAAFHPYTAHSFSALYKIVPFPETKKAVIQQFLTNIPIVGENAFFSQLSFLHYAITGEEYSILQKEIDRVFSEEELHPKRATALYWGQQESTEGNMYEVGKRYREYIRNGDVAGLLEYMQQPKRGRVGKVAESELRQWKNIFIHTIALAENAAIEGGLSPEIAYKISDLYDQKIEGMDSPEELINLNREMRLVYAEQVAKVKQPANTSEFMKKVLFYIQSHADQAITTSDVAAYLGYSRSYLSSKVKLESGKGLKELILHVKLEKAKELLRYSEKSLSEISSCLCFSSQSHFQKAFRMKYHATPMEYRKNNSG